MSYIKLLNLIKFNISAKKKYFYYSPLLKDFVLINKLIELNVIKHLQGVKNKHNLYKITISYVNNSIIYSSINLLYKPSNPTFVKLKTLKELKQYTHSSIYLVFTNNGLLTISEAISTKVGGVLFCQFKL
jgi:ribosomal protein S8